MYRHFYLFHPLKVYVVGATSLFLRAFYIFGSQYIYLDGEIDFLRRSAIKLGYPSGRGVPSVWLVNPRDSSNAQQARTEEAYSRRPLVRSISCRLIFRLVNTLSTQALPLPRSWAPRIFLVLLRDTQCFGETGASLTKPLSQYKYAASTECQQYPLLLSVR